MHYLTIAFPTEAAGPAFQTSFNAVRPIIGLSLIAAAALIFKPLLSGLLRAGFLVVAPRKSRQQRAAEERMRSAMMLNRMARELEAIQPGQAAELRNLAARD